MLAAAFVKAGMKESHLGLPAKMKKKDRHVSVTPRETNVHHDALQWKVAAPNVE